MSGMTISKQRGFSLMELMIALTILGIIVVISIRGFTRNTDEARMMAALATLKQVHDGFAEHYMKTGSYPEFGSWEAMVSAGSALVTGHRIPVNVPLNDPWGNPYEGKSTKTTFELRCAARPDLGEGFGPMVFYHDRRTGVPGEQQDNRQTAPSGSVPAAGTAPQ